MENQSKEQNEERQPLTGDETVITRLTQNDGQDRFTESSLPTAFTGTSEDGSSAKKYLSTKQRKNSLTEYQSAFMKIPKITDRKNVFISRTTRDKIVGIVRLFGTEKTSVSGFIENMVLEHVRQYEQDWEAWKKLL